MTLTVALDWTPNTNHLGFFVAAARGWYDDRGLSVDLFSPARDGYAKTPAKRVATGEADLGIAPSESAISYATHPDYDDLVAVAALAQRDTSAIAVLEDSPIERPRDLDGRTYASYGARFEDDIVAELIRTDGGEGEFEAVTPEMLDVPDVLLSGEADATWVFLPWEGLLAERDGTPLRGFGLDEYGVPYGYTPVLLAHPDTLEARADEIRSVLAAAARGYRAAAEDPGAAADDLAAEGEGPHLDDREFLAESARRLSDAFLTDDGEWGRMSRDRWGRFADWLVDRDVLAGVEGDPLDPDALDVDALFTDDYLPGG
jgi:NitT/TauT family transport system substrate-binding protein